MAQSPKDRDRARRAYVARGRKIAAQRDQIDELLRECADGLTALHNTPSDTPISSNSLLMALAAIRSAREDTSEMPNRAGASLLTDTAPASTAAEVRKLGIALTALIQDQTNDLVNAVAGIRIALLPEDDKHHIPVLASARPAEPTEDDPVPAVRWGVYCLACSDAVGAYVTRCERLDPEDPNWPTDVVVEPGPPKLRSVTDNDRSEE